MCVEERWYLHWLILVVHCWIYCLTQTFDLSMGYRQIKIRTNDIRNIVLLVVVPRAYTIISFGSDQCYNLVHIIVEFHLYGNLDELLLRPSATFLSPPWFVLNIPLVLETSKSIIFMSRSWSICWMKEVTFSDSRAFGASCRHEFETDCFCFLCNHPKSVMHVRSMLWFDRLATSILYVSLAHQATDWFVQGKGVVVLILGHAQDFVTLDDGS